MANWYHFLACLERTGTKHGSWIDQQPIWGREETGKVVKKEQKKGSQVLLPREHPWSSGGPLTPIRVWATEESDLAKTIFTTSRNQGLWGCLWQQKKDQPSATSSPHCERTWGAGSPPRADSTQSTLWGERSQFSGFVRLGTGTCKIVYWFCSNCSLSYYLYSCLPT